MTNANGNKYRLGLDLGTNSIGWAAVNLDDNGEPCGVLDIGVRIFPDGRDEQSKTSNAVARRTARGARRRRDRYLDRRKGLMDALVESGLMPQDEDQRKSLALLDPYELRANAVGANKLPAHDVGRALFHLNQRRGFQSNRKTDSSDSNTGVVRVATEALNEELKSRTLGEFLYDRHRKGDHVRFRNLSTVTGKAKYEFYPTRKMVLDEFEAIWKTQAPHYQDVMTADAKESLRKIIFFQKDLASQSVGKCTLDPARDTDDTEGFRCPWAHPLAQRFRVWQEVRNLEVQETGQWSRPLSKEEGDKVAEILLQQKEVSFDKMRSLLGLSSGSHFNLESQKRKGLMGDQTATKLSHKDLFGKTWRTLLLDKQIEIVEQLLKEDDEETIIDWLKQYAGLGRESASRVASALLPDRHCRLGLRAIKRILSYMMEEGMNYPRAAKAANYDHARAPSGELSPTGHLPYYGEWLKEHLVGTGDPNDPDEKRWGRYPNPTVHIGLGQLRRVVNALIDQYGRPHQVVVEMTRNFKLSKKQRDDLEKDQAENQKKNDARTKEIEGLGLRSNYQNRLKMRLWEELNPENASDRHCPYSGKVIGLRLLFSDEVQIDHLIPFQDCWDDSASNKIVCFAHANQEKGKKTPYEAFRDSPEWDDIAQRAAKLPHNKRRRFASDARQRFDEQGGFLARQLNETGWLARLAKEYLEAVVSPTNIWVVPGRLTYLVRNKWKLNDLLPGSDSGDVKKRQDHRHHAIDALVVALTDRSLLQRMSSAYDETRSRIKIPPPWEEFHNQVNSFLDRLVVSYKPDHEPHGVKRKKNKAQATDRANRKTTGQLHKETAYGLVELSENGPSRVVVRKKLSALSERSDLDAVRDPIMRKALMQLWDQVKSEGGKPADFAERAAKEGVLLEEGRRQTVRRVRVLDKQTVIPIKHRDGKPNAGTPYKGYLPGGNEFADVWRMRDGSWRLVVVSTFDANQPDFNIENFRPTTSRGKNSGKPDPAAKQLMRLQINDMGAIGEGPERRIVRVRKISNSQSGALVWMDDHNETNVDSRIRNREIKEKKYSARQLRIQGFRKVGVDEIGRVRDPGPRKP